MHREAMDFLEQQVAALRGVHAVLEMGSRNINGSPRQLFDLTKVKYLGIDIRPGSGVDRVFDCADPQLVWVLGEKFDVVICAEVFEHTPDWPRIVRNAAWLLERGGTFLATMATEPRAEHSAITGGPLVPGEHYQNVELLELDEVVSRYFREGKLHVDRDRGDLYVQAVL